MLDNIKESVTNAGEKAKQILNRFIDAIAMFIITYCAIPVIVVLLVIWFIKFLFGITRSRTSGTKARQHGTASPLSGYRH